VFESSHGMQAKTPYLSLAGLSPGS